MFRFFWQLIVVMLVVGFVASVGFPAAVHDAVGWSVSLFHWALHLGGLIAKARRSKVAS